jgi:hypothetical protein
VERIKTRQAAVVAAVAIGILILSIWRSAGQGEKGAPIPAPFTGGGIPGAPGR